jgi:hypothetical protein
MDDYFVFFPLVLYLENFPFFFFSPNDLYSYFIEKFEENFHRIPQTHLQTFAPMASAFTIIRDKFELLNPEYTFLERDSDWKSFHLTSIPCPIKCDIWHPVSGLHMAAMTYHSMWWTICML